MKLFNALLAVTLLASCNSSHIEFNGKAPGLTNGVFLVKEGSNSLFSQEITTGTFHAAGNLDSAPGYYTLDIMDNSHTDQRHEPYEVYLEPGTYTVEANKNLDLYPKITSTSKNQQDLSAYYAILDSKAATIKERISLLERKLGSRPNHKAYDPANADIQEQMLEADNEKSKISLVAFRQFMQEHPESEIAAHLMSRLDMEDDPAPYYAIYQKMSPAAKNTEEGKEIGLKLASLVKLLPGAEAPAINGATPDGKPFDLKKLDKQIYVIDFWRAGNEVSRLNHQDMLSGLLKQIDTKKAGIISISLDSRRDWWTTAIKDDHLTWPQYADLKGDNSPNVQTWVITSIPTYYLVDGNWHVIARGLTYSRLTFEINDYLKHHSNRNHTVLQYSKNMVGRLMAYSYAAGEFAK